MTELLFAYGTLKDSNVQQKIVGRKFIGKPDILEGFTTIQINIDDDIFPILIEAKNKNVEGLVFDILASDFSALDEYEGSEYKRARIKLKSGKTAWVYKKNE